MLPTPVTGLTHNVNPSKTVAQRACFIGMVQGVGFRPFVYRLASRHGLKGWVQNRVGEVYVHVEGDQVCLQSFLQEVVDCAPGHACPQLHALSNVCVDSYSAFVVLDSTSDSVGRISVPPDTYLCMACANDLCAPNDQRYQYPFINCSHCGPRYSIITGMPYDRANTSMMSFPLCLRCENEYREPNNRRFHAEPIACPDCGPQLMLSDAVGQPIELNSKAIIPFIAEQLAAGAIVAMKSVGGYHLLCDATNEIAIRRLRDKKNRPHKPFAVMYPESQEGYRAATLASDVMLTNEEWHRLSSDSRPILLVPKKSSSTLATNVAPQLARHGVMLPCSALHKLLLDCVAGPLVATSANISGEPVITDEQIAYQKLHNIVDYYVNHNRPIVRPVDDSVMQRSAGRVRPIRLGRGVSPLELSLQAAIERPTIAVGAHQKNTVSLAWNDRLVVSPHIGDLTSVASQQLFDRTIVDLQELYGVRAEVVVCDMHPGYASTRWAQNCGLPLFQVQHHQAHASAWAFEYGSAHPSVVFVWDGVGLGEAGQLWGGEVFYGVPGKWRRVVSFKPFSLQGGERAGREPWRSAAALCWQNGLHWSGLAECDPTGLARHAWQNKIHCHQSSSAGRLFDAAAAISLDLHTTTYEAQAPMMFESLVVDRPSAISLPIEPVENSFWQIDWAPLLPLLLDSNCSAKRKAEIFHASMANVIGDVISLLSEHFSFEQVGLTGGVFQNQVLASWVHNTMAAGSFEITLPQVLPMNDGAISIGQLVEHAGVCASLHGNLSVETTR